MGLTEACDTVQRTWGIFVRELPAFEPQRSVFHLAYLSAPEETVQWIAARSLGVRLALSLAGRITSDGPIVLTHVAYLSGTARDAYPVPPARLSICSMSRSSVSSGLKAGRTLREAQEVAIPLVV